MTYKTTYTEDELNSIRLLFEAGKSDEEIAQAIGRPLTGVKIKRTQMRLLRPSAVELSKRHAHKWTKDEEEFILNFWREKSDKWMAKKLGVTLAQYKKKRSRMKNSKGRLIKTWTQRKNYHNAWTFNQEEFLREKYPYHSAGEIARYLGKSVTSVWTKAHRMGLCKGYNAGRKGYPLIEQYYDNENFVPKQVI